MGIISQAMGCIFIKRAASADVKDNVVIQIAERQAIIEERGEFPPICIFPEGGTSNGTCILPFKRGAFASGRAVKPIVMKVRYGTMTPCYDIVPFIALAIMNFCLVDYFYEIIELPTFVPNDYLYQNHQDKLGPSTRNTEVNFMPVKANTVEDGGP
jgi:lysophosphatidylcholine acyltransferase/lyso-PAF acetyltransferase